MGLVNEKIRAEILDGCLTDYNTGYLAGNYYGYSVALRSLGNQFLFSTSVSSESDPGNIRLAQYVGEQTAGNRDIVRTEIAGSILNIYIKNGSGKKLRDRVNALAEPLFGYLRSGGYQSICPICRSSMMPVRLYEINRVPQYLCESCAQASRESFESNKENVRANKSNWAPGLVGAVLGALVGVLLWVVIYYLGYIAGLAGFVMAVLALKGYEKFGGCLDVKGVIICVLVMIGMVFLANKLSWSFDAYLALKEYDWGFFECFQQLDYILGELDLKGSYYGDLVVGFLLTAVGGLGTIIAAFKKSTGSYSFIER